HLNPIECQYKIWCLFPIQLEKIEELTIYILQLHEDNGKLKQDNKKLKQNNEEIKQDNQEIKQDNEEIKQRLQILETHVLN
ncbi:unnamed protein product, partial [marine sediment metagenome]